MFFINNKIYIGSAINIYARFKQHKSLLKRNEHHSIKLQNCFWEIYHKYENKHTLFNGAYLPHITLLSQK